MREASVTEAAVALGVSVDTVKRKLKTGAIAGRKDAAGRWVAFLDNAPAPAQPETASTDLAQSGDLERLQLRLSHAEELIAELRSRVAVQDAQITGGLEERAELRRLLAAAMQVRALPANVEDVRDPAGAASAATATQSRANAAQRRPWWRFWGRTRKSV